MRLLSLTGRSGIDESEAANVFRARGHVARDWSGVPLDLDGVGGIAGTCPRLMNADYGAHVVAAPVMVSIAPIGSSHDSLTWAGFYACGW
ncbi:hypothetical protein HPB48_026827 [Haemaphysalis longicornis]|uniref:Uncharacterized protein n=1 Tax=Haemaphysalis longicornis TaxID=44386 RepID=A0A9J6HAR3_HAELO|nr:hypothetical protein HPB48_026827 [Haemaphysalis longicornis]